MYMYIIIIFVSVCDRFGSSSDLLKSWGGSVAVACGVRLACSVLLGTVLYCPCHLWRALCS